MNRESLNMLNSMSSQEFSSAMRSNPTINNISVNLNRPINPLSGTVKSSGLHVMTNAAPLHMCQSNYDNDIGVASSHYQTEESSLVSAEYAAMTHEEIAKRRQEDKEIKLQQFQNKTKANAARKMREEAASKKYEMENSRLKKIEN